MRRYFLISLFLLSMVIVIAICLNAYGAEEQTEEKTLRVAKVDKKSIELTVPDSVFLNILVKRINLKNYSVRRINNISEAIKAVNSGEIDIIMTANAWEINIRKSISKFEPSEVHYSELYNVESRTIKAHPKEYIIIAGDRNLLALVNIVIIEENIRKKYSDYLYQQVAKQ